jgi:hypothetical protein
MFAKLKEVRISLLQKVDLLLETVKNKEKVLLSKKVDLTFQEEPK